MTGETRNNMQLSQDRAEIVGSYLRSLGFRSVNVSWAGSDEPADTAQSAEAYARNRRVDLTRSVPSLEQPIDSPAVQGARTPYPAMDAALPEPAPRTCCTLFPGGMVGFKRTEYLDPASLRGHRYGESGLFPRDPVGLAYTARGGFIDLGHVRDLADTTRYIASQALAGLRDGVAIPLAVEGGQRTVEVKASPVPEQDIQLAAGIGARAAYELAVWHEIVTWFNNVSYSSFSPEDNFSNLLGALIGRTAICTPATDYDLAVDDAIDAAMYMLVGQPADVAVRAIEAVSGLWYNPENDVVGTYFGGSREGSPLWRRHVAPLPAVTPWLVSDLDGLIFAVSDPTAGVTERIVDFNLGQPRPVALTLGIPETTTGGLVLSEFYDLAVDVDTSVVSAAVLPNGRSTISGGDLSAIVGAVRDEIRGERANGDVPN